MSSSGDIYLSWSDWSKILNFSIAFLSSSVSFRAIKTEWEMPMPHARMWTLSSLVTSTGLADDFFISPMPYGSKKTSVSAEVVQFH